MAGDGLFPADFERRVAFMLEPLRRPRLLPQNHEERSILIETACDWLERFLSLIRETREQLLNRALNPSLLPQTEAALLHPTAEPILGWDWQDESETASAEPALFDPETIERAAYLVEQLLGDASQPFFRELALLEVDRLDLLISLLKSEDGRLKHL